MAIQYEKILVPLDGSTLATQALPHAEMLAHTLRAELTLFRAVEEVQVATEVIEADQAQQRLVDQAERSLKVLAESLEHQVNKPRAVLDVGEPAQKIIEYAKKHGVDLIVMSTHGRTGLSRLVYGSVAEAVLHTAPCSVLLIRASIKQ